MSNVDESMLWPWQREVLDHMRADDGLRLDVMIRGNAYLSIDARTGAVRRERAFVAGRPIGTIRPPLSLERAILDRSPVETRLR